ncbi:MAG: hypothetical protein RLZZ618_319 [Pseudomonadota bacterium]|jgi:hypothetical protein
MREKNTMIRFLMGTALALSAVAAQAEACLDNFEGVGTFGTDRSYKTFAVLPDVPVRDAFARVSAFTAGNGFTILSSSGETGVIAAAESSAYAKGKTVPLNITVQAEGSGSRVALHYTTVAGVLSPIGAIKRHFCTTLAAAGRAQADSQAADKMADKAAAAAVVSALAAPLARVSTPRGFAPVNAEQRQAIQNELPKALPHNRIQPQVEEAGPAIASFIERVSCLAEPTGASALNEFAAPGHDLGAYYIPNRPMRAAVYHNRASCMTVVRVHGWVAPAANALRFEAVYKAEDSGETIKLSHDAIRQPDGVWLFVR